VFEDESSTSGLILYPLRNRSFSWYHLFFFRLSGPLAPPALAAATSSCANLKQLFYPKTNRESKTSDDLLYKTFLSRFNYYIFFSSYDLILDIAYLYILYIYKLKKGRLPFPLVFLLHHLWKDECVFKMGHLCGRNVKFCTEKSQKMYFCLCG